MEKISNRPKMTMAVAGMIAVVADGIMRVGFKIDWAMIIIFTICWIFIVIVIVLCCKKIVFLKKNHFDVRKFFVPRPIHKVSAVIPNYNYAEYLKERVEMIISQKYPIYELIFLDDKSTDDSVEVIKKIVTDLKVRKPNLKVKFILNEQNSGNVFKQWEKCFEESGGDYVWICEADDACSKYFLNSVMRAFTRDEDVVLSYAESLMIDEVGNEISHDSRRWADEYRTGHWNKNYINSGKKELKQFLSSNNTIVNASGVVFKKKKIPYKKYLRKAQEFRLVGDWYFYAKCLLHGKIAYSAESLNYHRLHDNSVTSTTDDYRKIEEIEKVQKSIAEDVALSNHDRMRVQNYRKVMLGSYGISEIELKYLKIPFEQVLNKSRVKDDILLSVIVSAYNAEKYLNACLDSVEKSLPERSEIIVVDDGSTDKTRDIIKKHVKKCPQMKYFYKKNGGLSSAKNYGLSKATGRYVIFMDADDEVKVNGYSVMLKIALEKNADVVVCDMALIYDDGTVINCPVYHENPGGLKGFLIDGLMASSNNKMVKKELYDRVGKYPEGLNNEDVAITPVVMALSRNTQYVASSFYKYYQRKGSIQNSEFNEKRFGIFDTTLQAVAAIEKVLPDEAENMKGIMIGNQVLALLVHAICNIEDEEERKKYIKEFCNRYNALGISSNKYIQKFCDEREIGDLPGLIRNSFTEEIYAYVKHEEKKESFIGYLQRAFGFKK